MYRIIDKKCSGKTSRLMLLAKEQNGIIVCKEPMLMRQKAYDYGIVGIDFISYYDFKPMYEYDKPVFIDEIDLYFKYLNSAITGYTISDD